MSFLKTDRLDSQSLMDLSLNEILGMAMPRWEDLTGVKVDQTRFTFGDLDIRSMNETMAKMRELEPDGTTAFMLLEIFLRSSPEGSFGRRRPAARGRQGHC